MLTTILQYAIISASGITRKFDTPRERIIDMKRSERLARENKVDTTYGVADVVTIAQMNTTPCSYVGTQSGVFNDIDCTIDIYAYDDKQGYCAVVSDRFGNLLLWATHDVKRYTIVIESAGGVRNDLMSGFDSFEDAYEDRKSVV